MTGAQRPDRVPDDLASAIQWVGWRLDPPDKPDGKPRKVPVDPKTGENARSTDGGTWGTLSQARQCADRLKLAGVGFVFTEGDPFAGIDLDHCRHAETGEIEEWAQDIIDELDSYTEVSPSGTGVHIIIRGALPKGGRRRGQVEMYDTGRYFTFTGNRLPDTPTAVEERQEQLDALHARVFETEQVEPAHPPSPPATRALDDDEVIEKASAAKNGAYFRALWEGDHSAYVSSSEGDLALCGHLAFWTDGDSAQMDRLFRRSGLMRDKWDKLRGSTTYGERTIQKALTGKTEFYSPKPAPTAGESEATSDNQATLLVRFVHESKAELFHNPAGDAFATISVRNHRETHRIGSKAFERWLGRLAYRRLKTVVQSSVIHDASAVLSGEALYDGPEMLVYVRLAGHDGTIYLDPGRSDWEAIAIGQSGWKVCKEPPVRFRRPAGFAALPMPTRGGDISRLRGFVNVSDGDWSLILGWLVSALRPRGPYPILGLTGEHGSAKSTTGRIVRRLVDPNAAPLRAQPRDTRDLMIAANNGWVLAFDNLSSLPPGLSDALCMVATGGGFATRTLYTDDDETIFDVQRPILCTSIEDILGRADLLDRTLLCQLPGIEEKDRREENELWREFEAEWPGLLGALLDAVVVGMRRFAEVKLDRLPRMADFARWASACEPGLGLPPGAFMKAYAGNREAAVELALESDVVAQALIALINDESDEIETTATGLLQRLDGRRGEGKAPPGWPRTPKAMGTALRRIAPNLRAAGYEVSFRRVPKSRRRLIRLARAVDGPDTTGPTGPTVPPPPGDLPDGDRSGHPGGTDAADDVPPDGPAIEPDASGGPVGPVGTQEPGADEPDPPDAATGTQGHLLTDLQRRFPGAQACD